VKSWKRKRRKSPIQLQTVVITVQGSRAVLR
jgi:hypothetical protein